MEYGPALPPKQNYTLPIGPEMPKELVDSPKAEENKVEDDPKIEVSSLLITVQAASFHITLVSLLNLLITASIR